MSNKLSHIPPNDDERPARPDIQRLLEQSGGVERAAPALLEQLSTKRAVFIAEPGSDAERFLNYIPAEASAGGVGRREITLRPNPSKAVVLEEFLHGVQDTLKLQERLGIDYSEWHVRDFMLRHHKLIGLSGPDAARLDEQRRMHASVPEVNAHIQNEAIRKSEARIALRQQLALTGGASLPSPSYPLSQVYPSSYSSMTKGRDEMGERNEISRIAVERTGFDYGDARNDMRYISARNRRGFGPNAHMLMLTDGSVQGPEAGGVDFGRNPQIAAGKNGGTLGVMYVGAGAMNKAQQQSFTQIQQNLQMQRKSEGLTGPIEVIAGSTRTAQLLNLPTPRGPLPAINPAPYVPAIRSNFKASVGMALANKAK